MNEHTLVYTLHGGWTPVGQLAAGVPHCVLVPWAWEERFFDPEDLGPAWYAKGTSAASPLTRRTHFRPWDPRVIFDRKMGCLHRLGKYSVQSDRWLLPTQELVDLAVRLAIDCGVPVYYKGQLGFEAALLPKVQRPENATFDFEVGANLLKLAAKDPRLPESLRGPDAVRFRASGPVLTRHRFVVGAP